MTQEEKKLAISVLKEAKELIKEPDKWTTEFYARDAYNNRVSFASDRAVCFCASGAIRKVLYKQKPEEARWYLQYSKVVKFLLPFTQNNLIGDWNDASSHEEVLAAFDKAIALAETEL